MTSKKASWKQKVDPAFDKIIKYFLHTLNQSGLPANTGWILLEDHYLKIMEQKGMQGWIEEYKNVLDMETEIKKIIYRKNTTLKERNQYLRMKYDQMKVLPEESRGYYRERLKPLLSEKHRFDYFGKLNQQELKDSIREYVSDCYMLAIHLEIVEIENMKEHHKPEVLQKKFEKAFMFMSLWTIFTDAISLLVFKKSIYALIKEASNGDEESFFKLLQIDRTVIEFDWAKKMIRKAQLTGDKGFFDKMAKAISTAPLENTRIYGQALIVLLIFWRLGMYRLENNELIELLEDAGIKVQEDPETFRKFVNREVKPLFQEIKTPY